MNNGKVPGIVERLETGHRGMKSEKSIQIDRLVLRNRNARAHRVIILFAVGNDDIQTIDCATLKDDDQPAIRYAARFGQHRSAPGNSESPQCPRRPSMHLCEERTADSFASNPLTVSEIQATRATIPPVSDPVVRSPRLPAPGTSADHSPRQGTALMHRHSAWPNCCSNCCNTAGGGSISLIPPVSSSASRRASSD